MKHVIQLPWPPTECSPNWRGHWGKRAKAAKKYKSDSFYITRSELRVDDVEEIRKAGKLHLFVDFYPKVKRNRDVDNCVSMMKNGLDGLADALCVNDSQFVIHPFIKDELGGFVKITITDGP